MDDVNYLIDKLPSLIDSVQRNPSSTQGEMMGKLNGAVAIVTGGAHGMGAETARLFATEGAEVIIADVREAEGVSRAREICSLGGNARFFLLDVTSDAAWDELIGDVLSRSGKLNVLVNNAGISGSSYTDPFDIDGWHQLLDINLTGVFLGMKHAIPAMLEGGGGSIVNLSSISGNIGQDNLHLGYNGSKAAVRMITKSAAARYGHHNIRVNSVHPGLMPPMLTSGTTADPAQREIFLRRVPLRRAGKPEEVAWAILFLACDDASYITGAELHVDGGFLAT
jgi:NAD(P)-dependent dehydrogenase (short-subunit alcohol dehydrogenase family)